MADRAVVLVLNSEKILVDLLVRSLEGDDLAMFGAASVVEAARLFEQHQPDLVIVGATVPDGFDFMDQVQSGLKPARVVALVDSDDVRKRVTNRGIDQTVEKTAGLDALVSTIRSFLPVQLAGDSVGILVVDDEDGMRTMLMDYLGSRGYAAFAAKDGSEALQLLEQDLSIRLVLLDVSMPRMGGLEALRQIMRPPVQPDVIMMTAVADREIAKQTLKAGAFDYVLKPFDLDSMESSIVACLSYSDYHKQPWWKKLAGSGA